MFYKNVYHRYKHYGHADNIYCYKCEITYTNTSEDLPIAMLSSIINDIVRKTNVRTYIAFKGGNYECDLDASGALYICDLTFLGIPHFHNLLIFSVKTSIFH